MSFRKYIKFTKNLQGGDATDVVPAGVQRVSVGVHMWKMQQKQKRWTHQTRLYLCTRTQMTTVVGLYIRVRAFTRVFFLAAGQRGGTRLTSKKCGNTPGDPASLLLDQREEFSKDCF